MSATNEKLERLFDKIRSSSEARQAAAIEALSDIASEPYTLSALERVVLEPALQRAKAGDFADEKELAELLNKPW